MTDAGNHRTQRIGLLLLVATSLGWGLNWPVMKVLLEQLPPLFARGSAGMVAGLVLAAIAVSRGDSLRVPRPLVGRLLALSTTNVFAWMGFSTLSLQWLDAGQAAMLVYTMPIWATLLAWPLSGQRPGPRTVFGLLLSMAGLWTLLATHPSALPDRALWGIALALAAALLFALGTVALQPLAELAPLPNLAWQLCLGCFPMVVYGVLREQPQVSGMNATGWALMAYMTVIPMGACYLSWFAALRRVPPATASVVTLLTPVIGVWAAATALGEPLGAREIGALALTVSGVALVLRRRTRGP